MAAISQMTHSNAFLWMNTFVFWFQFQLSLSPNDIKPALVQVMSWRRKGVKPLPDPMLIRSLWRIYAALGGDELNVFTSELFQLP